MQFKLAEFRELLALKKWSHGELARRLNIQTSTVGRWAKQINEPNAATVMILRIWLAAARAESESALSA